MNELMKQEFYKPMRNICEVFLILLLFSCSRVQVSQDYDTGMNFNQYNTYEWRKVEEKKTDDLRESSPLIHKRLRSAVDHNMTERGYGAGDNPDFYIHYDYSITTRIESAPVTTSVGFGVGSYYRFGGIGFNTAQDVRQYDVGILTVDFYDAETNQLTWRGTGSDIVYTHMTNQELTEMINGLVQAVLDQFPPGS